MATWYETAWEEIVYHFNNFIAYFEAQEPGIQFLIGLLIVLGFIAAGFIVFGVLWLIYQLVKITVVGTIILVYLAFVGIKLLVMVFYADRKEIAMQWDNSLENMDRFFKRCYPPKDGNLIPPRRDREARAREMALLREKRREERRASRAMRAQVRLERVRARTHGLGNPSKTNSSRAGMKPFYCTSCGQEFSEEMGYLLSRKKFCYCKNCGQKFVGNVEKPVSVPASP
ncbi:hypothetical protein GF325_12510 [Candidatus Bathyarchaeota archaeon]|nr:hypothetical protein [Candidatus Bathyarchaeota archaeon]